MAGYDGYSLVLIHWLNFGPWGSKFVHEVRPGGLVIEEYTHSLPMRDPVHRHVKSIARMRDVIGVRGTHVINSSGLACNALGEPVVDDPIQPVGCHEVLYISHFYTRSREDFKIKVARGNGELGDDRRDPLPRRLEWFEHYVAAATVEIKTLSRSVPRVKALLQAVPSLGNRSFPLEHHVAAAMLPPCHNSRPRVQASRFEKK